MNTPIDTEIITREMDFIPHGWTKTSIKELIDTEGLRDLHGEERGV